MRRAIAEGHDLFAVLRAATLHPVRHYGLPVGLLQPGDPADFVVVDNLRDFRVRQTYIDGRLVAELARPVRGVAAGQAIVGYQPDPDGDIVLGSATISHATSLAGVA